MIAHRKIDWVAAALRLIVLAISAAAWAGVVWFLIELARLMGGTFRPYGRRGSTSSCAGACAGSARGQAIVFVDR
jgi:hypothetical protein